MTKAKSEQLKMQALYETRAGLYALGEDGVVYVYQGADYGWSRLNMSLMNRSEVRAKMKARQEAVE